MAKSKIDWKRVWNGYVYGIHEPPSHNHFYVIQTMVEAELKRKKPKARRRK